MRAANEVFWYIHECEAARQNETDAARIDSGQIGRLIDRETGLAGLVEACEAALYLLGRDVDRERIGEKPWAPLDATHVPEMLREAIRKAKA